MLCLCLATLPCPAIVNGEAPAKDDTRFDAVASHRWFNDVFKDDATGTGWSGCAVLIAPDVVLTAKHVLIAPRAIESASKPGVFSVRFRRHTDGSVGNNKAGADSYHSVRVKEWIDVGDADLAMGILEKEVTHIKPARILLDEKPFKDRVCILAGWGSTSRFKGSYGPRPGLHIGENTATTQGKSLRFRTSRTENRKNEFGILLPYFIEDHAVVNNQDSGGSLFVFDEDGEPMLAGILATYQTAVWLPANRSDRFPLKAATQGAAELKEALNKK